MSPNTFSLHRVTPAGRVDLCVEIELPDIGLALQLSPANAQYEVDWATRVETLFPNVFDALAAGVISEQSAHAVVDPTEFYPEIDIAENGTTTLPTRWGQTYTTKPVPVEEPPPF